MKWKRKTDNKMKYFGDTDYEKMLIRINKKKSKKSPRAKQGYPEVLDSIKHEEMHRAHPKMKEKTVKDKTKRSIKKMGRKTKQKYYSKYK